VAEPPHSQKISNARKESAVAAKQTSPNSHAQPGGDRDDLVDTPALRGGRLVRHGGLLRRQRLGRFFCAGLYDGKSEYRREHHEVCRTRRSSQQLRPRRTTVWPGWPHGAVRRSTGPADAFQSFPRLRLQLHASSAVCSPPRQRGLNQHCGSRSINRASFVFLSKRGGPCARRASPSC
jgi:hypothetical protein